MTGTPNQIEWAEEIKPRVGAEFDRVAKAFEVVALHQKPAARAQTEATIALLREKQKEVMAREDAGYFIKEWQELTDQVRQMLWRDPRYQELRSQRLTTLVRT
jgi:hypothetical protein